MCFFWTQFLKINSIDQKIMMYVICVCMYMCVSAMAFAGTTITKATFAFLQQAKNRRAPYALELDAIGRGHDGGQSIKFTRKFSD